MGVSLEEGRAGVKTLRQDAQEVFHEVGVWGTRKERPQVCLESHQGLADCRRLLFSGQVMLEQG